jgi:selenocysteine-specific elongation factor
VALTKSDLVDPELIEIARDEIDEFVRGSFLEGAPVIPVSSRTGEGLDHIKEALGGLARRTEPKLDQAITRLPIDRAFSMKGFGTVVTGTLVAGQINPGDEVEVLPTGLKVKVRNLQVHGRDTERAVAGQRTAVNLQGVSLDQVRRGMVLAPAGCLKSTRMLDVLLDLLASASRPLAQRARVRLHHGTAEVMARVVLLQPDVWSPLEPGKSAHAQLRLEEPITALPGDRFIIRSYSPQITIGGGMIIDALPDKHRIRDRTAYEYIERLGNTDRLERAAIFIEMAGDAGMSIDDLVARTGDNVQQLTSSLKGLAARGRVLEVSGAPVRFISESAYRQLASRVVEVLTAHHRREPLSLGPSREEVRDRVFGPRPEVFRTVVGRLVESGAVVAEKDAIRLSSHRPALNDADAAAKKNLESAFKKTGLQASTIEDAASALGFQVEHARKLYNLLAAERRVVRIGDFVFHAEAIEELKTRVKNHKSVSNRIDVAVFKELTGGLTRKYAIPLLEYLDRERITRRIGNEREIL